MYEHGIVNNKASFEQFARNLVQKQANHFVCNSNNSYLNPSNRSSSDFGELTLNVVPEFDANTSNLWTQQITDFALIQLVNMCQPFKWILNCIIIQNKMRDV